MKKLWRRHWFVVLLTFLAVPLFFYKLGQTSLVSWDEAWYAEIARNIFKTGDLFNLTWNGQPYLDHPPAGFWLIALAFGMFKVSEFWARFMPALTGLLSLPVVYFLGRELFGKTVGLASAIALPSSFWFLYRARSGNLDVFLTFFFLLTLLLAIKSIKRVKYLIPFSLSLSFLFLTKTLVPLAIVPSLIIIFSGRKAVRPKSLVVPGLIFLVLVGGWFVNQLDNKEFLERYFQVGLPGVKAQNDWGANIQQTKVLLHNGIGKWFWPGVVAVAAGLFLRQRRFYLLSAFALVFISPFLFSQRGGIWHLIPLYPILILSFFGLLSVAGEKLATVVHVNKALIAVPLVVLSIYVSFFQLKRSWYEFIDIAPYVSDEQVLSQEAGKYPQELLVAGSDFVPTAVFYSGKHVPQVILGLRLPELFASNRSFLLIVPANDLDQPGISKDSYQIIKKDRDKLLVLTNPPTPSPPSR